MGRIIPFCVATSTGPSHNVGINIQQQMSSMKYKKRMKKRYPALTYNTKSSTVAYNGGTLATLVSAVNAQTRYLKKQKKDQFARGFKLHNQQPFDQLTNSLNQQLQLLYKNVCEDIPTAMAHEQLYTPLNCSSSCPVSKLEEINSGVNLSKCKKHVCIPKSDVNLLYVSQEFETFEIMSESEVSVSQIIKKHKPKTNENNETQLQNVERHCIVPNVFQTAVQNFRESPMIDPGPNPCQQMRGDYLSEGREKKLKDVLMKLHDEFEQLDKKYEDLSDIMESSETMAGGDNEDISKELNGIEKELTKKEDEIVVIMALCNEVITLKQRLKYMECLQQKYLGCLQQSNTLCSKCSFTRYPKRHRRPPTTRLNKI